MILRFIFRIVVIVIITGPVCRHAVKDSADNVGLGFTQLLHGQGGSFTGNLAVSKIQDGSIHQAGKNASATTITGGES